MVLHIPISNCQAATLQKRINIKHTKHPQVIIGLFKFDAPHNGGPNKIARQRFLGPSINYVDMMLSMTFYSDLAKQRDAL